MVFFWEFSICFRTTDERSNVYIHVAMCAHFKSINESETKDIFSPVMLESQWFVSFIQFMFYF